MSIRPIKRLSKSKPTIEGAGVHLRRALGFGSTSETDPFLLLDDFRGDVPDDYLAGFPWHPHRGIETITYVLAGTVEHGDSMGNSGAIGPGDVQRQALCWRAPWLRWPGEEASRRALARASRPAPVRQDTPRACGPRSARRRRSSPRNSGRPGDAGRPDPV